MALSECDLSELLDAIRAGGEIDLIRRGVELVLQALIEAEATEVIGAGPHERTTSRTNQRNGRRPRLLSTKAGDVELAIPKLRRGSFFPSVLERRRRIDRATFAVVMEAYVHGVSTRKVDDLVTALGLEAGISKSEVSRICAELDTELDANPALELPAPVSCHECGLPLWRGRCAHCRYHGRPEAGDDENGERVAETLVEVRTQGRVFGPEDLLERGAHAT